MSWSRFMSIELTLSPAAQRKYPQNKDIKQQLSPAQFRSDDATQQAQLKQIMDEFAQNKQVNVADLQVSTSIAQYLLEEAEANALSPSQKKEKMLFVTAQTYIAEKKAEASKAQTVRDEPTISRQIPTRLPPDIRANAKRLSTSGKHQQMKPSFELLSEPLVISNAVENILYIYQEGDTYMCVLKVGERLIPHILYEEPESDDDDLFEDTSSDSDIDMLIGDEITQLKKALDNLSLLEMSVDLKKEILRLMGEDERFKQEGYHLVFDSESEGAKREVRTFSSAQSNEQRAKLGKMFASKVQASKAGDAGEHFVAEQARKRPPPPPGRPTPESFKTSEPISAHSAGEERRRPPTPPPPPRRSSEVSVVVHMPEGEVVPKEVCEELIKLLFSEKAMLARNVQFETDKKTFKEEIGRMTNDYVRNNPMRVFVEGRNMPSMMASQKGKPLPPLQKDQLSIQIRVPNGMNFSEETFDNITNLLSKTTNMKLENIRINGTSAQVKVVDKLKEQSPKSREKSVKPLENNNNWRFMIDFMAENPMTTAIGVIVILAGIAAALIAFGVFTGGAGYAPFVSTVAAFIHTTPTTVNYAIGVTGATVAGLTTAGLTHSIFSHQPKKENKAEDSLEKRNTSFPEPD